MATESSVAGLALARACFAVRIVNIDSHMAPALHKDAHSGAVTSAYGPDHPVIRIFGATPAGQKCCVHVHGVSDTQMGRNVCVRTFWSNDLFNSQPLASFTI